MSNETNEYETVQHEIKAAVAAQDTATRAAALSRAQLELARLAAGDGFDPRRHRAISNALRALKHTAPNNAPVAALATRGAR